MRIESGRHQSVDMILRLVVIVSTLWYSCISGNNMSPLHNTHAYTLGLQHLGLLFMLPLLQDSGVFRRFDTTLCQSSKLCKWVENSKSIKIIKPLNILVNILVTCVRVLRRCIKLVQLFCGIMFLTEFFDTLQICDVRQCGVLSLILFLY